nr:Protein-N(5)-glutamine methyltransferase PrmC, methylates polypeptide chain release factors RF1 and RF2 [Kibdelosporangium sp. MJ126-NF4]CTQ89289.1 Protein-N(5)-glutamine methyltransferase PrmC, methylates polypeptide chain release factors RF1 and RF2 [Kibdelosporangium sp. MJ126-NF4]
MFAEDEAHLLIEGAAGPVELAAMVDRRISGLPLEHVLGWAEFCGLRITVHPGVFVPRRRTEFLVSQALALVADGSVVVDLCCGSGAVGAALAAAAHIDLHAVDIDPAAVDCARHNVADVHLGDLYTPLPVGLRGRVDVLVANAPYVPTDAIALMPAEARDHEPLVALDGGADGLAVQRRVAAQAREWLAPGGHLLIETSDRQAADTAAAFTEHGLRHRIAQSGDLSATVVIGEHKS